MFQNLSNRLFVCAASLSLLGCGASSDSALKSNVASAEMGESSFVRYESVEASEFCQNSRPEQCFTFIMSVPSPELENELGLNTLALSSKSEDFRVPLLRSCHRGLETYIRGFKGSNSSKRAKLFGDIKESRCVFDYVKREIYETLDLPQGQLGFASRISSWSVKGRMSTTNLTAASLTLSKGQLDVSYRNAQVFGKPADEDKSRWTDLIESGFWRPSGA